ncbi:MAG: hypothetical protein H0U77_03570 [Nocardioidaceae bacterium]|nr:hypothetical protein [Nocardioidaceae bacterium]
MARRRPSDGPASAEAGAVPEWVYTFTWKDWWDADEQPPVSEVDHWRQAAAYNVHETAEGSIGTWRWCQAQRRWRQASEAWCAERGYSFCRTVLGWRRPGPNEVAAGRTASPWGDRGTA